jgi:hypothetical protein
MAQSELRAQIAPRRLVEHDAPRHWLQTIRLLDGEANCEIILTARDIEMKTKR